MRPKVKHSELLYSDYFDLRKDLLERPDGQTHPYTSLILSFNSVAVLARTKEGLWVLNREYRHPTGKTLLGLPGGRLEKDEDPVIGGMRELIEETGFTSEKVKVMGCCHPFPGLCDQKIHYLLALDAYHKTNTAHEPFEFIEVELKTDDELHREIDNGGDIDGNLCTALWYYSRS